MCKTERCRKIPKRGNYCASCIIRKFKEAHPEKYAYFVLKNNAKARKKVFTITFEYFLKFITKTKYMRGKGINVDSLHIDRKREEVGYVPRNLQVLTNKANLQKYLRYQYDEKGKPTGYKTETRREEPEQDYPF